MPVRLRPTAPIASDAILVGDPGRALLLAQQLLEEPRMSNHARGLWGYSGRTPAGDALTIQATGMGGPSAALVLGDLAELGVRRAVRVGTCAGLSDACEVGDLLLVAGAIAESGSIVEHGVDAGATVQPDAKLTELLREELGEAAQSVVIASFDTHPAKRLRPAGAVAADMQTATLLATAHSLEIQATAVLIVAEAAGDERLETEALAGIEKLAGGAASAILSS